MIGSRPTYNMYESSQYMDNLETKEMMDIVMQNNLEQN